MLNDSATLVAVAVALAEIVTCVGLTICVTVVLAGMPLPVTSMPTAMPAVEDRFVSWLADPAAVVVLPVTLAPVVKLPSDRLNVPAALLENVIVCTSLVPVLTTL